MEGQQPAAATKPLWEQWGNAFVNYTLQLGDKIAEGASFAAQKTKEGALYVAEKSKPVTDKIKEGALYVAEKTKPATDKIKEGAQYVGNQIQNVYVDTKSKITGVPPEQAQAQKPQEGQPREV